ncbi:hypothetical protein HDV05_003142, partial [Chytridiales sp. JEL 0842]
MALFMCFFGFGRSAEDVVAQRNAEGRPVRLNRDGSPNDRGGLPWTLLNSTKPTWVKHFGYRVETNGYACHLQYNLVRPKPPPKPVVPKTPAEAMAVIAKRNLRLVFADPGWNSYTLGELTDADTTTLMPWDPTGMRIWSIHKDEYYVDAKVYKYRQVRARRLATEEFSRVEATQNTIVSAKTAKLDKILGHVATSSAAFTLLFSLSMAERGTRFAASRARDSAANGVAKRMLGQMDGRGVALIQGAAKFSSNYSGSLSSPFRRIVAQARFAFRYEHDED